MSCAVPPKVLKNFLSLPDFQKATILVNYFIFFPAKILLIHLCGITEIKTVIPW